MFGTSRPLYDGNTPGVPLSMPVDEDPETHYFVKGAPLSKPALDAIRAIVREELAALKTPPSPPQALQDKFRRIGLGSWVPTPGVTDEDTEVYLTIEGQHLHVMSVEEALALSDDELKERLEEALQFHVEGK